MARAFTAGEKDNIRRRLLQAGRRQFARLGVRKTGVAELAAEAGIAKGTFYLFFESKEDLFLALHEEYETELRRDAFWRPRPGEKPGDTIRRFLNRVFELFATDPMLGLFASKEEFASLSVKMPQERFQRHQESNNEFLRQIIQEWQQQGVISRHTKPQVVAGVITSLFFTMLNKDYIGEAVFPQVSDWLVEALVSRLTEASC
jgi:AcrR family transcriptional regulator